MKPASLQLQQGTSQCASYILILDDLCRNSQAILVHLGMLKSGRTLLEGAGRGVGAAEAGPIGAGGLGREGDAAAAVADEVDGHDGGQEAQHEAAAHSHLRPSIPPQAQQFRPLQNREAALL